MARVWLKKIRKRMKLTHQEVADGSGIKRQYYGMIENGVSQPSVEVAKRIAETLGFEWTLFFEKKSNKTLHLSKTSTA